MPLDPTALDDIQAAAGGFFSIGGTLLSASRRNGVFAFSRGKGIQRLVVEVSCQVGTPGPDLLMGTPSADCISGLGAMTPSSREKATTSFSAQRVTMTSTAARTKTWSEEDPVTTSSWRDLAGIA